MEQVPSISSSRMKSTDVHQGGVVPLPIKVPTGLMSGRFSPSDSSLHLCGLVGWSSDASEDGGSIA